MEILFRKLADDRHDIVVRSRCGPDIQLPAQPTGPTIPHDLAHAARVVRSPGPGTGHRQTPHQRD
jgi:hypothetical protein